MNTKLLNELELHLHNSEMALQLAKKAVAELKAEMIVDETAEHAAKTPAGVDLNELKYKYGLLEYLRNSILADAIQKLSIQYFQETHPNHSFVKGLCLQIEPDPADYLGGFLETEPTGVLDSIFNEQPKPIDFYAKLEGEHYSHKPCSTDTCEPKTFLHRKLLEKRLPFQTLLAGLGVATPDELDIVYAMIFENKPPRYNVIYDTVCDFIENYKPHGEV